MTQAYLALEDGSVYRGMAFGALGETAGELCFNTSMTGYQEILTDPSYAEQIIVFTYPHIGNVGTNRWDWESARVHAHGAVIRAPRAASSWRAEEELEAWLKAQGVVAIADVDTRAIVRKLRTQGAMRAAIASGPKATPEKAQRLAQAFPGLIGRDLVRKVATSTPYRWEEGEWSFAEGRYADPARPKRRIVAMDFGCKRNILRMLASRGGEVRVVPPHTSADEIMALKPDGVFLSNGPGDPAPIQYGVRTIAQLLAREVPIFGICLGHQLLAQALGMKTFKLKFGHRGGNHPVMDLATRKVEITSQNHGFAVDDAKIPEHVEITHRSLFDDTVEGLAVKDAPAFSVQYHPEASPGPHDGAYLFDRFFALMEEARATRGAS